MDNKMAVFNNREFGSIRVIEENGNYLFCGFDVAKALGYAKPRNAINTHCKGALKRGALTEGGVQELTFIPEGDVYRLIVHSRLPGAERFEKWVFDEVLPMIRKTGGYMTASLLEQAAEKPEILLAFADQLLAEHEKNRQLSGEVERLRPKADFYDAFVHEENCTNIRATAKELQIGERAFCRFLMDAGFLYRCPAGYLLPYAKPSNDGLFRVKDFWKYGHFGQQTLITPQGKNVIRLLLDDGQMRLEWKERMGYPDIHDHDDLGRYYIEELDAMQVPEHLRNYIDYEAYGRDIALEESGQFTDLGYVRDTGDSFHEYYDGERSSIPEEYRVMTFQDDIPEEEISEWAMDLAYDMDEFFRQHDPQYAAEHPEEHAAKEEIYENLSDCRIASLEEKLKALGQTPEDYLPSELEKFKEAVGYEAYLDVDPQVIREAIENPDQSHVDEMLAFAEQANREYEVELYGQQAAPTPDDRETGETVRTPRGTFHVTDMSREQMEAAGYGFHHESEDGKYLIMANGSRAFAIPSGDAPEHTAPEKLTVLVVEPMKEPYVKEIDPGLHALQAEVGGDIAASYPFDDPVGLVLNDEGKLIGLDLNRSLRDEHGEIYDIVAGTFLVVGLGPESFASLPPDMIQKYTEQFKRPELFASISGQIVSVPVEPENPLRTAEMTLEDDYGMIDGIINNGRRGEELEKAQTEVRRTTPEKKPSIRERLEDAKRECAERKSPDKPAP